MQIEVDSEHAKRYVSGLNCTRRSMRKYVKFGGGEAQNQVILTGFSILLIWFVCGVAGMPG